MAAETRKLEVGCCQSKMSVRALLCDTLSRAVQSLWFVAWAFREAAQRMRDINKSALSGETTKLSDDAALSGLRYKAQHAPREKLLVCRTQIDVTLAGTNLESIPIANGDR